MCFRCFCRIILSSFLHVQRHQMKAKQKCLHTRKNSLSRTSAWRVFVQQLNLILWLLFRKCYNCTALLLLGPSLCCFVIFLVLCGHYSVFICPSNACFIRATLIYQWRDYMKPHHELWAFYMWQMEDKVLIMQISMSFSQSGNIISYRNQVPCFSCHISTSGRGDHPCKLMMLLTFIHIINEIMYNKTKIITSHFAYSIFIFRTFFFHRSLYWVDSNIRIVRAAMDGSNKSKIIVGLTNPRAITIDFNGETIDTT